MPEYEHRSFQMISYIVCFACKAGPKMHEICLATIDSLDGLTFRNLLISILLVMPTGQHLHAIFSLIPKNVKIRLCIFESMAENR